MHENDISKWTNTALAIHAKDLNSNPGIARTLFLQEVSGYADQTKLLWNPTNKIIPALSKNKAKLPADTEEDLRSLRRAVQGQDNIWFQIVAPKRPTGKLEEAKELHDEILSTLEYAFDDDIFDIADEHLAKYKALIQNDEDNIANYADRLGKVASLAKTYERKLQEIADEGDFDMSVIDKAFALSEELGALPPTPLITTPESQAALDLRNRFMHLLIALVEKLRGVVRFKYRAHPDLEEKFSSAQERRRSARLQRSKKADEKKQQAEQSQQELEAKKARIREALQEEELVAEVKRELEAQKLSN